MDRNPKPSNNQSRRAFVTSVAAGAAGMTLLSPGSDAQTPTSAAQPVPSAVVPAPRKPIIIKGGSCAIELKRGDADFTYDKSKKRYLLPASQGSVETLHVTVIGRNEESQDLRETHPGAKKVTLVLEGPSGIADTLLVEPKGKDGLAITSQHGEWLTRKEDDHPKRKCSWNHLGFKNMNDTLWFSITQIVIEAPGGPYPYDGAEEYRLKIRPIET